MIIDLSNPSSPQRRPITADSALMNPGSQIIALKAAVPGVTGDNLQIFDLAAKAKLKSVQFPQAVVFWKWISASKLGLVTATSVYHWDVEVRRGRQAVRPRLRREVGSDQQHCRSVFAFVADRAAAVGIQGQPVAMVLHRDAAAVGLFFAAADDALERACIIALTGAELQRGHPLASRVIGAALQ